MKYRGIEWKSNRDLSKKLGKCDRYVKRHLDNGETIQEIIDYILNNK